ncbi:serine hydrolase [Legionella sp. km772]|uniref:serine hydrolase n=1 Tax=Legionella sp. km772 TaxID=2498111 RepID=UPI000F8C69E9|nr:serine hydrolase [Legionella sp. km772]RUR11612.1 hypothetical protein ELY15_07050 [Legionella sp. km772]
MMTISQEFIKRLKNATGNESLPIKFWADYSNDSDTPTFQDVLDKYADYYKGLSVAQQKEMSKIFWEQVKDFGTPIIEEKSDGQSEVYFLFPRGKLSDVDDKPGTKKNLYLQGDFHGYGSTLEETQELTQLSDTDVMCRRNTMPKDALVTYYYVQLDPKHSNKEATHFYGDVAYRPSSFFPVIPSTIPVDKPPAKTREELQAADTLFYGVGCGLIKMSIDPTTMDSDELSTILEHKQSYVLFEQQLLYIDTNLKITTLPTEEPFQLEAIFPAEANKLQFVSQSNIAKIWSLTGHPPPVSALSDEFSKYQKIYDDKSSFFCADPDKDISTLGLPVNDKNIAFDFGKFFSDAANKARVSLVSVDDKIVDPSNLEDPSKISRSIQVFAPQGEGDIDQVVIISDGRYYQLGNTVERLDKLLSKNTAVIFITPEQGIEAEAIKKGVEFEPADALTGMGARTVDLKYRLDEYAKFIHQELLPELVKRGIKIPTDPDKRVLVGASLGGTASIYMGMEHPEWFGKVVAQSPSINNRGKLEKIIDSGKKPPPPEIYLSCGEFESPKYAKNLNIPFAEELAEHLGVKLHTSPHGHQMEAWSPQLEDALPALGLSLDLAPIKTMIEQAKIPGVTLARVSGDGDIATETAGVINTNTGEAVTDSTVFQAASLSKPVFAYIVLKMVEDGKFSRLGEAPESGLDRPLHEICDFGPPELRDHPNYKLLTPRNLLSHQASLPNWFKPDEPEAYVGATDVATVETSFNYSGLAYCFLNEVVEHIAGKPLDELSREVFDDESLEMNHTSFVPFPEESDKQTKRAVGHKADGSPDERAPSLPSRANPAASLVTTSEDYAKFLNACLHDEFIRSHMFEPQLNLAGKDQKAMDAKVSEETLHQISWGIGMGLQTADNGDPIAFHWGDNETSRAFTAINLRTNEAVVCFTNSENGPSVFQQIAEPVVGSLTPVSQWLSRREGLIFAEDRVSHDTQLTITPKTTGQYKDKMQEIRKTEPGYMASTESSRAKEREKYSPFQTTPKPPWKL